MQYFTETEFKYLAGLADADGNLSFKFTKNSVGKTYCSLEFKIVASEKIDKDGKLIKSLSSKLGHIYHREFKDGSASPQNWWRVSSRRDLNLLLPMLIKHMVIKGSHFKRLYDIHTALKGKNLNEDEINRLKQLSKDSRIQAGPVKAKNFATKAWTSGMIDGDGYLQIRDNGRRLSVTVNLHPNDKIALDLLQKTYGGYVRKINNHDVIRWERNLGPKDKQFAINFLQTLHKHSRLKKWKIEQMLSILHNHSQRLSDSSSTEGAIV